MLADIRAVIVEVSVLLTGELTYSGVGVDALTTAPLMHLNVWL